MDQHGTGAGFQQRPMNHARPEQAARSPRVPQHPGRPSGATDSMPRNRAQSSIPPWAMSMLRSGSTGGSPETNQKIGIGSRTQHPGRPRTDQYIGIGSSPQHHTNPQQQLQQAHGVQRRDFEDHPHQDQNIQRRDFVNYAPPQDQNIQRKDYYSRLQEAQRQPLQQPRLQQLQQSGGQRGAQASSRPDLRVQQQRWQQQRDSIRDLQQRSMMHQRATMQNALNRFR